MNRVIYTQKQNKEKTSFIFYSVTLLPKFELLLKLKKNPITIFGPTRVWDPRLWPYMLVTRQKQFQLAHKNTLVVTNTSSLFTPFSPFPTWSSILYIQAVSMCV